MKGDFSRDSFRHEKHYSRVLMQQGRVQLDADWNEQVSILLDQLQSVAHDLIGPFGGPAGRCGFAILDKDRHGKPYQRNFGISKGRYYVGGILCEKDAFTTYTQQLQVGGHHLEPGHSYVVYLDVWEEYVSPVEDPGIVEIALSGADTCGRARVAYVVRVHELEARKNAKELHERWWDDFVPRWQPENRGMLKARTQSGGSGHPSPGAISQDSHYRGAENQLYRVEVHHGGRAAGGQHGAPGATVKWSRENGSIVFPVARIDSERITLEHLGRDSRFGIQTGDWVELSGPAGAHHKPRPLCRVIQADSTLDITVEGKTDAEATMIRRWDQKALPGAVSAWPLVEGTVPIREGTGDVNWIPLEDGIEIQFQLPEEASHPNDYRSEDYWLIPARTANGGQVEWPSDKDGPLPRPANGIEHHYAPLAIVDLDASGTVEAHDCRSKFSPRHDAGA